MDAFDFRAGLFFGQFQIVVVLQVGPELRRGSKRVGYVAGDIKSGGGEDGQDDDTKLKRHYGVQLSLYTDILERKGLASSRTPFVWDVHGKEVPYDLDEPQGVRNPWTVWEIYQDALTQAQRIIAETEQTKPDRDGN